nr:prepilin-type N-terminal cleavage/methylation domain-containing protein [Thiocystis violascens]
MDRPPARRPQRGMTLLELLVVVALMSVVGFMALSQVGDDLGQARYQDTKNRLEMIRKAIIGDTSRTLNGQPEIRGFVADMGRLPRNLTELLTREYCQGHREVRTQTDCETYYPATPSNWLELPESTINVDTGLRAGWNGPYLVATADEDGAPVYRDGWGNDDGTDNFGWRFDPLVPPSTPYDLIIQSYGMDGKPGGDLLYEEDYPPAGSETLVYNNEYCVLITDWDGTPSDDNGQGITVDFGSYGSSVSCSDGGFVDAATCLRYGGACRVINYWDDGMDTSNDCNNYGQDITTQWVTQINQGWSCDPPAKDEAQCTGTWEWRIRPGGVCNLPERRTPADCEGDANGVWVAPANVCRNSTNGDIVGFQANGDYSIVDQADCSLSNQFWSLMPAAYILGTGTANNNLCLRVAYRENGEIKQMPSSGSGNQLELNSNGNRQVHTFTFGGDTDPYDTDTYLHLGEMAYRFYRIDNTDCSISPSTVPVVMTTWRRFTLIPGTVRLVLPGSWPIN